MKELLIEILEIFGFPVIQQGSLGVDEQYPESFFTFWNNETYGDAFYDNKEHESIWNFDLNFYSSNPDLVNIKLNEAVKLLKHHDFIVSGEGYDVGSDEPTHTGRGINIKKIKRREN
ncbi:MAG: hypothetical protein HFJ20_06360 [Clostridia bacterium]|nr:hypothetical protein [Clostridia bacterium]